MGSGGGHRLPGQTLDPYTRTVVEVLSEQQDGEREAIRQEGAMCYCELQSLQVKLN